MKDVFADTYYFLAVSNRRESGHEQAIALTRDLGDFRLVTTPFVIAELGNFLRKPHNRPIFIQLLEGIKNSPTAKLVPLSDSLLEEGVTLFSQRPDKEWSLTDCITFVVMQQMGLTEALTGDHHFEQAGFKALLA